MKLSRVDKGNAIVRKYKAIKYRRNIIASFAVMDFAFGAMEASKRQLGPCIINGGLACLMSRLAADLHALLKVVEPEYNKVVARAKQIKLKKK